MAKEPHAAIRARERYGLELTTQDLEDIGRNIKRDGVLVANQSDGGSIWLTKVKGVLVRVVISKNGFVRTFLDVRARLTKARMGA